jgi:hypothetical protein
MENVSFCGGNAAELWWGLKRIDRYFLLNNQGVTGKIKSDVLRNEKYGRKAEIPSAKLIRNGCWR